jgi:hypothetical protein
MSQVERWPRELPMLLMQEKMMGDEYNVGAGDKREEL